MGKSNTAQVPGSREYTTRSGEVETSRGKEGNGSLLELPVKPLEWDEREQEKGRRGFIRVTRSGTRSGLSQTQIPEKKEWEHRGCDYG